MEDMLSSDTFDFTKQMPGEESADPHKWVLPIVDRKSPAGYASDLVGSG